MGISAYEAGADDSAPITQAEQVQDIFARSFSDPAMTAEQTRAELQQLQSTISVDLYMRLALLRLISI
eukprot:547865-Amphidinium_carterae.1